MNVLFNDIHVIYLWMILLNLISNSSFPLCSVGFFSSRFWIINSEILPFWFTISAHSINSFTSLFHQQIQWFLLLFFHLYRCILDILNILSICFIVNICLNWSRFWIRDSTLPCSVCIAYANSVISVHMCSNNRDSNSSYTSSNVWLCRLYAYNITLLCLDLLQIYWISISFLESIPNFRLLLSFHLHFYWQHQMYNVHKIYFSSFWNGNKTR